MKHSRRLLLSLCWLFIPAFIAVAFRTFLQLRLGGILTIVLYAPFLFLLRSTWSGKFDKKVAAIPASSHTGPNEDGTPSSPCSDPSSLSNTKVTECASSLWKTIRKFLPQFRIYVPYLIAAVLFASGIISSYHIGQNSMQDELSSLEDQLSQTRRELSELKRQNRQLLRANNSLKQEQAKKSKDYDRYLAESNFMNRSLGFVVDGSDYYHAYRCHVVFKALFIDDSMCEVHNNGYCEYLGYSACPICH